MTDVKRSSTMGKTSSAPDRAMPKSSAIKRSPLKDQVRSGGADKSMGGK